MDEIFWRWKITEEHENLEKSETVYRDRLHGEGLSDSDRVAINIRSRKLLWQLMHENPDLARILESSATVEEVIEKTREWITRLTESSNLVRQIYHDEVYGRSVMGELSGEEIAAIRILDYLDHSGQKYVDLNRHGELTENHPFKVLWLAYQYGRGGARPAFFADMIMLFRQLNGKLPMDKPSASKVVEWMARHPSGLEEAIVQMRQKNKRRILGIIIDKIDNEEYKDDRYNFPPGLDRKSKMEIAEQWWNERLFHLRFAVRDADTLNQMLDYSIDEPTMSLLYEGTERGIPIFVNPYYLSLLLVNPPERFTGADQPIRDYIFISRELLNEFGEIVAWEKEDEVEPGKPNAAGWILPNKYNLHRRYPEVAILIPNTIGRSCGGLCVSCQRMYDFQRGNLNFDLDKLKPGETWWEKLEELMEYFENDSQLCDILITGGDALMSSNKSLRLILDAVFRMAVRKRKANASRNESEKYAEIVRVRLGTRLPVYLPMRINDELVQILSEFRQKGLSAGIRQFVIQTHFESAMEITPEAREAVSKLISAGWTVTNQQVFTASASRRGHTAKLRKVLNDIGILPYYTFSVKGYLENYRNFATNARSVQEMAEEKVIGRIPEKMLHDLKTLTADPETIIEKLNDMRQEAGMSFLATDRNMLNLPGVGKSLTFRTVGITRHGRRILEFDHDTTRNHSPVIEKMGKVIIIESKPVREYLRQLEEMGEDITEYENVYGYSIGFSEPRLSLYKYPRKEEEITSELTNFSMITPA